ncbi:hypothetical protein [Brevundimonas sp.]|uniref:hypothetical protein n=1 Tax=Brevundimonas sp. TaxID=1871086 RepID=UPI003D6C7FF2
MSMTGVDDIARDVFARSASALAVPPPADLLAAAPAEETGDTDRDDFWFLWEGAAPFLANARVGAPVSDADRDLWAGWLTWAIAVLDDWDADWDDVGRDLDVALALLDLTQRARPDWEFVPATVADNAGLRETVEARLRAASKQVAVVNFYSRSLLAYRPDLPDPKGETGWKEIVATLNRLEIIAPAGQRALARLAWRLWPDGLAALCDDDGDVLGATALAEALAPAHAFALGARCRTPLQGFAAILAYTELRTPLEPDAQQELEALLVTFARDPAVWRGWMAALNRYPVRHPRLQAPLGRALSRSSKEAFLAWLSVIELRPLRLADALQPVDQRGDASTCLKAFSDTAAAEVRAAGWRAVWARWSAWDFDRRDGMMKVHGSDIDLGVVGYALEVMRNEELDTAIATEAANLNQVFAQRWPSVIALITAANLVQSRLQPLAHARTLKTTSNQLELATGRYSFDDPELTWRLKRAGCE